MPVQLNIKELFMGGKFMKVFFVGIERGKNITNKIHSIDITKPYQRALDLLGDKTLANQSAYDAFDQKIWPAIIVEGAKNPEEVAKVFVDKYCEKSHIQIV